MRIPKKGEVWERDGQSRVVVGTCSSFGFEIENPNESSGFYVVWKRTCGGDFRRTWSTSWKSWAKKATVDGKPAFEDACQGVQQSLF